MDYRLLPQERMQQRRMMPPTPTTPARVAVHESEDETVPPLREEMFAVALFSR